MRNTPQPVRSISTAVGLALGLMLSVGCYDHHHHDYHDDRRPEVIEERPAPPPPPPPYYHDHY